MKLFVRSALVVGLLGAVKANAGNPTWAAGKVVSPALADGTGWDAAKYAGVAIVRHHVAGEPAVQIAGPDPDFPTMIFTPPHAASYFLTDVGSQWNSAPTLGQTGLEISEAFSPQHHWSGQAFAGAVTTVFTKEMLSASTITFPDNFLSPLPVPVFDSASTTHVSLRIPSYADAGGRLGSVSIWRRQIGAASWDWKGSVANPAAGQSVLWDDGNVQAQSLYEYSVTLDFLWTGGGGAGSRPSTAGIYSTLGRGVSQTMAASLDQPTPTPVPAAPLATPTPLALPDGWIAYPNPVYGSNLSVEFQPDRKGEYSIRIFTLAGEAAIENKGKIEGIKRTRVSVPIPRLSAGVYLVRVKVRAEDGSEQEFPLKKVAVVH